MVGGVQTKWFIEYILRNTGNPEYYTLGSVLHSHIITQLFFTCKMFLFRIMLHRTLKQFYNPFIWSQTLFLYPFMRRKLRLRTNLYVHRASKRTGNYLYLASKFNFCTSKMPVKPCPTLLAVMMKIFFTIQYGSQYPQVVIKHVKCS